MIRKFEDKNETISADFSLGPQGVLHKIIQYHQKEFKEVIAMKALRQ